MSQEAINRAAKIEAWLADEEFSRAFELVEQGIYAKFKEASSRDAEAIQLLKLQLTLLGNVKACLERTLRDGKIAAEELRLERERDRWRDRIRRVF